MPPWLIRPLIEHPHQLWRAPHHADVCLVINLLKQLAGILDRVNVLDRAAPQHRERLLKRLRRSHVPRSGGRRKQKDARLPVALHRERLALRSHFAASIPSAVSSSFVTLFQLRPLPASCSGRSMFVQWTLGGAMPLGSMRTVRGPMRGNSSPSVSSPRRPAQACPLGAAFRKLDARLGRRSRRKEFVPLDLSRDSHALVFRLFHSHHLPLAADIYLGGLPDLVRKRDHKFGFRSDLEFRVGHKVQSAI